MPLSLPGQMKVTYSWQRLCTTYEQTATSPISQSVATPYRVGFEVVGGCGGHLHTLTLESLLAETPGIR